MRSHSMAEVEWSHHQEQRPYQLGSLAASIAFMDICLGSSLGCIEGPVIFLCYISIYYTLRVLSMTAVLTPL